MSKKAGVRKYKGQYFDDYDLLWLSETNKDDLKANAKVFQWDAKRYKELQEEVAAQHITLGDKPAKKYVIGPDVQLETDETLRKMLHASDMNSHPHPSPTGTDGKRYREIGMSYKDELRELQYARDWHQRQVSEELERQRKKQGSLIGKIGRAFSGKPGNATKQTKQGFFSKVFKTSLPDGAMKTHAGFLCAVLMHLSTMEPEHIKVWDDAYQELVDNPTRVHAEIGQECAMHIRSDSKDYDLLSKQYSEMMDILKALRDQKEPESHYDELGRANQLKRAKMAIRMTELRDQVCESHDVDKQADRVLRQITKNSLNAKRAPPNAKESQASKKYKEAFRKINMEISAIAGEIQQELAKAKDGPEVQKLTAQLKPYIDRKGGNLVNQRITDKDYKMISADLRSIINDVKTLTNRPEGDGFFTRLLQRLSNLFKKDA